MDALDTYLETRFPTEKKEIKSIKNDCCRDYENKVFNNEWYCCRKCGYIFQEPKELAPYKENISFVVKSFIPMSYKYRRLVNIHKWQNYSYYEVRDDKLMKFIDTLPIENREIRNLSKVIFKQEFHKVRTRAKVKCGLIGYCIYKAHLIFDVDIDLDDIFEMLDITEKHYNSAIKKVIEDKLFYPKNINKYLNLIPNKLNKNELIKVYNNFLESYKRFNGKTILLSLIYFMLREKDILDKKEFYKTFKISSNSVNTIIKFIDDNELKLFN